MPWLSIGQSNWKREVGPCRVKAGGRKQLTDKRVVDSGNSRVEGMKGGKEVRENRERPRVWERCVCGGGGSIVHFTKSLRRVSSVNKWINLSLSLRGMTPYHCAPLRQAGPLTSSHSHKAILCEDHTQISGTDLPTKEIFNAITPVPVIPCGSSHHT